jgi:hypothetical protein
MPEQEKTAAPEEEEFTDELGDEALDRHEATTACSVCNLGCSCR